MKNNPQGFMGVDKIILNKKTMECTFFKMHNPTVISKNKASLNLCLIPLIFY